MVARCKSIGKNMTMPTTLNSGMILAQSRQWEVQPALVAQDVASQAGRVALEIIKNADRLPYSTRLRDGVRIGIFDPEEYSPKHTIFGYDRSCAWAASLIEVIGEVQAAWTQMRTTQI
jgi:hypothetical protein